MPGKVIPGEIEPCADQGVRAAKMLQQLGFRVLHLGPTISVQAAQALWEKTFDMRFRIRRKRISIESGAEAIYPQPQPESVSIPARFQGLIHSIAIVEPPEWFDDPP
jgi:hypothetical protein